MPSVGEADADKSDDSCFVGVLVVDAGGVAEREEIDAAMNIPGAERARHDAERERHDATHVEESQLVVDTVKLVVVLQADTEFDGNRQRRLAAAERKARTDAEF